VVTDDRGGRMFVCSDTDYCERRRDQGQEGDENAEPTAGTAVERRHA
jgi:alpha-D-ribose 1-methylphosphonate 5-phosphate C-P lyase